MRTSFDSDEVARFENEVWSRCAERYDQGFGGLVTEAIGPLLDAAGVAAGNRVLDLGTGSGLVAAAVHDRGGRAVGIDFSKAMISVARRTHPAIEFHEGDAESLAFDSGDFDAVVGNFVLHHLGRPAAALGEAYRVLRDDGRIALTVWADPAKLEAFGLFFSAMEEHGDPGELPHGPLFGVSDLDAFARMLLEAGFRDPRVAELSIGWKMSSSDSLLMAFRDWAHMDALPESVRTAVEASVRAGAKGYEAGDALTIPNPAILMSAAK